MAIALESFLTEQSVDGNGGTTGDIDTSLADFIVLCLTWFQNVTPDPTISDSEGNTWSPLTKLNPDDWSGRIWYAENPNVGANHTFTIAGSLIFWGVGISAWSGMSVSSVFNNQATAARNGSTGTTLQVGPLTADTTETLAITKLGAREDGTVISGIDSSFTVIGTLDKGATGLGISHAYKIINDTDIVNPTWSFNSSDRLDSEMALFRGSGGGGGSTYATQGAFGVMRNKIKKIWKRDKKTGLLIPDYVLC